MEAAYPKDVGFLDELEVEADLHFLDGYVQAALENGAKPHEQPKPEESDPLLDLDFLMGGIPPHTEQQPAQQGSLFNFMSTYVTRSCKKLV